MLQWPTYKAMQCIEIDSFTSSSKGTSLIIKVSRCFPMQGKWETQEVRNVFQLTLKASRRAARKGSYGNADQMLGEAYLGKLFCHPSALEQEVVFGNSFTGIRRKVGPAINFSRTQLNWFLQSSDLQTPVLGMICCGTSCVSLLNSEPNRAFSASFTQPRRDQGASDPGLLSTGMFGYTTVSRDPWNIAHRCKVIVTLLQGSLLFHCR